jgi:diguanylate cyclase (GGDEF)-like protein
MKLLDWLRKPAESALKGAISDLLKVAAIGIVGAAFTVLLARIPFLNSTFWAARAFTNSEVALWFVMTAAAAVWITYSMMRRRLVQVEAMGRRKEDEALELSMLDPATGLLNLRALNKRLPEAIASARDTKQPLTMVIFDIDGFRDVNALVGHDYANTILRAVAASLSPRAPDQAFRYPDNVARNTRVVFRYGGDEFILLAFNTTIAGGTDPITGRKVFHGLRMAELLQKNVWDNDFPSLAARRRDKHLAEKLTISAGIAESNPSLDSSDTAETLTRRAELALIAAKLQNEGAQRDAYFKGTIVPYTVDLEPKSA